MIHPRQVWLVFAVCVLAAASAMAWLTREAIDADRQRRAAQAEAELEQRVSLALWRMDTELAPILAEEVIRPVDAFRPGKVATDLPSYVLLQFEALPDGTWRSPQFPNPAVSEQTALSKLSKTVTYQKLLPELPSMPLPSVADVARSERAKNAAPMETGTLQQQGPQQLDDTNSINAKSSSRGDVLYPLANEYEYQFLEGNRASYPSNLQSGISQPSLAQSNIPAYSNSRSSIADYEQRSKRYQSAAQQGLYNSELNRAAAQSPLADKGQATQKMTDATERVGVSRPMWIGDKLLLLRRVIEQNATIVQGAWLDWPRLKEHLLTEVADLLPTADLVPAEANGGDDPARMLAGLPVRLVVGESVASVGIGTTLCWALWFGWGGVLLAVAAAAALLHGVMTLSERRAAFVSSVTHELRTPLTTFRMYAEMLARGMVPDAARRQEYFETLQREAERLTLLVENVLAYARLERGRKPQGQDRVTLQSLLARVGPRLKQRAAQAEMECVLELPLPLGEGWGERELPIDNDRAPSPCPLPEGEDFNAEFTTDQAVVEQILFNLVDNAAKYAREAHDRRIHLSAERDGQWIKLTVRDHGPGIGKQTVARSTPFAKSAQDSAESAPGVGLGLNLCQKLARQLGGRLEVPQSNGGGTTAVLLLPTD